MYRRRPLNKRETMQLFVILTILAWATQTMLHQWGYGQDITPQPLTITPDMTGGDKFVPADPGSAPQGTLELQGEATILGGEIKLKQICRWSNDDTATFAPVADLTLARINDTTPFRAITVDDIRQTLHDAGMNVAFINFTGATKCTITRTDGQVDPRQALQSWIDAQKPGSGSANGSTAVGNSTSTDGSASADGTARDDDGATAVPASDTQKDPDAGDDHAVRTLKVLLTADICQRLNVDPAAIQMSFSPEDEKVLSLAEPLFQFDIQPGRVRNLGAVSWDVTIVTPSDSRKVTLSAIARAWQDQVIVNKPLTYRALLSQDDFVTRRVLTDQFPNIPLLTLAQCVGQAAAMDLQPGTIMNARLVHSVPMVHAGQLVTITLNEGTVQIRSVARAMDDGSLGENIKVRSETTRDQFDVTVTGPQEVELRSQTAAANLASATLGPDGN